MWCLVSFFPAEEEEELKKSAVVNWYLSEIESEIDSEEELINRKSLIEKVLNRLVHYVSTTTQVPTTQCAGPHHTILPPNRHTNLYTISTNYSMIFPLPCPHDLMKS